MADIINLRGGALRKGKGGDARVLVPRDPRRRCSLLLGYPPPPG